MTDRRFQGTTLTRLAGAGLVAIVLAGVAGCGSQEPGAAAADNHASHSSSEMPGMDMDLAGDMNHQGRPSATARMVCGPEIRRDVQQTFALDAPPESHSTWADQLFTCTYHLPGGRLEVSVQDADDPAAGRGYFDQVRSRAGDPALMRGLPAFGLPAFETDSGTVSFLKDGKTLTVHAEGLPQPAGPGGESRSEVAYAIAADVIGCWSE